jgi:hypothetical protein
VLSDICGVTRFALSRLMTDHGAGGRCQGLKTPIWEMKPVELVLEGAGM